MLATVEIVNPSAERSEGHLQFAQVCATAGTAPTRRRRDPIDADTPGAANAASL
jgi:hypothetical protein